MKFLSLVTLSGILVASVVNAATNATSLSGKTINVTADSLCIFMPKTPRELIAASEHDAIAFCNNTAAAPGAKEIPKGFIKSAHFVNGTGQGNYVQYTGSIDVSKYSLNSTDGGGQYDNHVSILVPIHIVNIFTVQCSPYHISSHHIIGKWKACRRQL
jgi:hypothetical protein